MIIRLFRGRLRPERGAAVLESLRAFPAEADYPAGLLSFTYGFRHQADELFLLAISSWRDFSDISRADGRADGQLVQTHLDDAANELAIEHYELVGDPPGLPILDGAVLGLVWGRVAPNAEAAAHEMVRAVESEIARAGVLALYVARRVLELQSEIVVVALWRERQALHAFAKGRPGGTLNPEFLKLLTEWRFETYDCLSPDRLLVPPSGPAVLLVDDDGRYVDASPGVEAVLGVPGELILHSHVEDLTPQNRRPQIRGAWQSFLEAGHREGEFEMLRPDGTTISVTFRAKANCPEVGLHASVVSLPGDSSLDGRRVEEIVADTFGLSERSQSPELASPVT